MNAPSPHLAYYRAHHGRWRARISVAITSWRAFWAAPMGPLDRLRGLWMGTVAAWTGLRMDTSVDCEIYASRGEVLHTTAVSLWGVPLMRSVEVMVLHEDGVHATMRAVWGDGSVEIAPDAQSAHYTFDWMGGPLQQRTRVVPEGLHIEQQNGWFRANGLLVRT
jgi:hypothetical protein